MEFFIAHGATDAPALDIRLLDTSSEHNVTNFLANRLGFGETTDYVNLPPMALTNIDAVDATDNTDLLGVFRFDLSGMTGQTFTLPASGRRADDSFALIGFDANGNPVTGAPATGTDEPATLPAAFTLSGNYPNPFNPMTTIQYDLPEAAEVHVEVVDLLGRSVLVLPAQHVAAGANRTLKVDATALASGVYLYRVIAHMATRTQTQTGRMTLLK